MRKMRKMLRVLGSNTASFMNDLTAGMTIGECKPAVVSHMKVTRVSEKVFLLQSPSNDLHLHCDAAGLWMPLSLECDGERTECARVRQDGQVIITDLNRLSTLVRESNIWVTYLMNVQE